MDPILADALGQIIRTAVALGGIFVSLTCFRLAWDLWKMEPNEYEARRFDAKMKKMLQRFPSRP